MLKSYDFPSKINDFRSKILDFLTQVEININSTLKCIRLLASGAGVHYDTDANGWWNRKEGWVEVEDKDKDGSTKMVWKFEGGASDRIPIADSRFKEGTQVSQAVGGC